jgi:thiol-disulfide isomerase/thioredoxin
MSYQMKEKAKSLLHAHFLVNFVLAGSYFLLKNLPFGACEHFFDACLLEWREIEIVMMLLVFIAVKTRKSTTYIQFIDTVCTFSKAANIILYWRESPGHTFVFALVWFLHFVFLPQPAYKGPENIQYLRGEHLRSALKKDERVTWLICFHVPWSPPCTNFTPIFAELSNKYAGLNNLKFGKFDCNLYPEIAAKHGIDTSALTSSQLPTVILFEKGVETKRRPFVDSKGSVYKFLMSHDNVVKDFDLNKVYYECKQSQIVVKAVEEKKDK